MGVLFDRHISFVCCTVTYHLRKIYRIDRRFIDLLQIMVFALSSFYVLITVMNFFLQYQIPN